MIKKIFTGLAACMFVASAHAQTTIFSENIGSTPVGSNTAAAGYTGYQNFGSLTYTATATTPTVRTSFASTGYTGASGGNNMFFSYNSLPNFTIGNINTSSYVSSNLSLTFGITQGTASTFSNFVLSYSTNGTDFTPISYSVASTSSTAWQLASVSLGSLPSTASLTLKWENTYTGTGTNTNFRIDDVILTAVPEPHEYALAVASLLGVVVVMRRRKAAQVF